MTYIVRQMPNSFGSTFDSYELGETETNSWVRVCPERGGIVVSFAPHGRELLYLDEATFRDKEKNIRGGIPVLWPICGPVKGGKYNWNGKTYEMAQHGLARILPWAVVSENTTDSASITLKLTSDENTKRIFPFDFELIFTYELVDGRLTMKQTYTNKSISPMPMYAGFHPYFVSPNKRLDYQMDAKTYLDYNDNTEHPFQGFIDLDDKVESVALKGASTPRISFTVPGAAAGMNQTEDSEDPTSHSPCTIQMDYGPEFRYVVVWHVQGKPFVCVEPWMALPGSLDTGTGLTMVEPGESIETFMRIGAEF